jgi:hypothetical protein
MSDVERVVVFQEGDEVNYGIPFCDRNPCTVRKVITDNLVHLTSSDYSGNKEIRYVHKKYLARAET